MGIEIERKFLLRDDSWRAEADAGTAFRQGYLVGGQAASVRVRIEGEVARLNIKGATLGVRRAEFEYPIPLPDAEAMLDSLCAKPLIEKTRYLIERDGLHWEVDVFAGDNTGLVVAEVELEHEEQPFVRPPWLGEEVSHDTRYYNVCLVQNPYRNWRDE